MGGDRIDAPEHDHVGPVRHLAPGRPDPADPLKRRQGRGGSGGVTRHRWSAPSRSAIATAAAWVSIVVREPISTTGLRAAASKSAARSSAAARSAGRPSMAASGRSPGW